MELALLTAATDAGVDVHSVRQSWPRVAEQGFDRVRRSMTVTCRSAEGTRTVRKGAPEVILDADLVDATPTVLQSARRRSAELAADGARVLAVAGRHEPERAVGSVSFELLGLVALRDPARASAAHTVAACHDAGMQLVLMTGDHPGTAAAIAREVGIRGDDEPGAVLAEDAVHGSAVGAVIARATPEDKVAMVRRWRGDGHVVAMTGDGVNDGPALHEADVGVAMGRRGTEVARQAADLILTDDDLQTIVAAVEEGRRVYANVRRFLLYGLAGGASEILAMLLGPFIGLTVPLLAGQLLWVNIVTHSFAGTALGVEPAESGSMQKRPRSPEQAVLGAGLWWRIVLLSAVLAGVGFAAALLVEPDSRQTALMLVLGSGQLGIAWGVRTRGLPSDVTRRPLLPLTLVGAAMLLALGALVPLLNLLLGTVWPDPVTWVYAAVAFCVLALATRAVRPQAF
jgi:Ca2+-transporting ATPase